MALFLFLIMLFVPAIDTCRNQTTSTTPTWVQCMENQFEVEQ